MLNQRLSNVSYQSIAKSGKTLLVASIIIIMGILTIQLVNEAGQSNNQAENQNQPITTPTPTTQPNASPTTSPRPSSAPTNTPTPTPAPTLSPTVVPTIKPTNPPSTPLPTSIPLLPEVAWGNRNLKQVIFTFDAGSGNQSLDLILNTLSSFGVSSSFFITGTWAQNYPEDLRQIAMAGHGIYNHTYTHPHLTQLTDEQIIAEFKRTDNLISSIAGFNSKPYFRAPYGERDHRILSLAASQGYRHVYWTVDALDWKEGITAQQVKDRILDNLQPGTIYLMHVGDSITGQILPDVFSQIRAQGYTINSLSNGL